MHSNGCAVSRWRGPNNASEEMGGGLHSNYGFYFIFHS